MAVWRDDNAFYLLIALDDERDFQIDLGEPGWLGKLDEQGVIGAPGKWFLVRKAGNAVDLMMLVFPGDVVRYVARHVGSVDVVSEQRSEVVAYGLVKTRDGVVVEQLWAFENGAHVAGYVEDLALWMLRRGIIST